ncbi:MAG: flavin monoamine oxidase family protein [Acidimicrobiia bacterium]|nr:flavin monoamine oxidase family protein [Acidimicrobiia bacterium]
MEETRVVVIGAGISGLTAARRLAQSGCEAVVLEARDRVGGRTLNHTFEDGTVVEMGGQWVGPTQDRVLALLDEIGLGTFPTYNDGMDLLVARSSQTRPKKVKGQRMMMAPQVLIDLGVAQQRLHRMARTVPLMEPWTAARAAEWDGQTAESWLRRNVRTRVARDFLRLMVTSVFSCEATDVSLLHLLFYCHSGGLWDRLLGTANGAQQDRIMGGSQSLSIRMAETIDVRLASPVRRVDHDDTGVTVHHDGAGGKIRAQALVSALPPMLTGRIGWNPGLGGQREQLTQNVPMGAVIKTMTVYDEPWWRADELSGQAFSLVDPVSVVFDNSPPDSSRGVLLAFIEGRAARDLGPIPMHERREVVTRQLQRFFGDRALRSIDYVEQDWCQEEWSGGCYSGRMTPGVWTQLGPALRQPIGRLHWAGTETADVWNGYFDGAVRAGERAATEVAVMLGIESDA